MFSELMALFSSWCIVLRASTLSALFWIAPVSSTHF